MFYFDPQITGVWYRSSQYVNVSQGNCLASHLLSFTKSFIVPMIAQFSNECIYTLGAIG